MSEGYWVAINSMEQIVYAERVQTASRREVVEQAIGHLADNGDIFMDSEFDELSGYACRFYIDFDLRRAHKEVVEEWYEIGHVYAWEVGKDGLLKLSNEEEAE